MEKLSSSEIEAGVAALPGWALKDGALTKQFEFPSFADLVSFLVKVGFIAEKADHHPDMQISYRRLTFSLSTHDVQAITRKDLELAKQIEAACSRY